MHVSTIIFSVLLLATLRYIYFLILLSLLTGRLYTGLICQDILAATKLLYPFFLSEDISNQESIDLLKRSGIQFEKHQTDGMDPFDFAAELIGAGVVLQQNVFLSFHR